jgi:Flp pilus assembly secretin CpaC
MRADVAFTASIDGVVPTWIKATRIKATWVATTLILMAMPAPSAAQTIGVVLDQATIAKVPDHTSTIVVGNPLIADVSIQAGGAMVVTGKGYGVTNLIVLDRAGKVLMERQVRVRAPSDAVVVYRGVARESYTCAPYCERRITLGDTKEYFDVTLEQTGNRNGRAQQGQAGLGVR